MVQGDPGHPEPMPSRVQARPTVFAVCPVGPTLMLLLLFLASAAFRAYLSTIFAGSLCHTCIVQYLHTCIYIRYIVLTYTTNVVRTLRVCVLWGSV